MTTRAWKTINMGSSISLASSTTSIPLNIEQYRSFGVYAVCSYAPLQDSAGNLYLQVSNDGVLWNDISGSIAAFTSTSTLISWSRDFNPFNFLRVRIESVSGTGGVVDFELQALEEQGA